MASQDRQRRRNPAWNTSLTAPTERSFRSPQLAPLNGGYQGGQPASPSRSALRDPLVVAPLAQWAIVGNIVGMAYVVARPKGRFEIRESVHTPKGPRARSLASFTRLTDEVLATASGRATRPFDAEAVRASAARAANPTPRHRSPEMQQFVESSRRMAAALETQPPRAGSPRDREPGDALIDLLGLVAQVSAFGPPRAPEPLRFPPLARLRAARSAGASR